MATPTIRQSGSAFNSSGAATVNLGSGTQVGDWIIAIHQTAFRDASDLVSPTPGTWTSPEATLTVGPSGTAEIRSRVWRRKVTVAGAQTVSIDPPGADDTNSLIVFVIAGADPDDPIDGTPDTATGSGGTSGTQNVGPITTTTPDALLISTWGGFGGSTVFDGVTGGATVTNGLVGDTSPTNSNNTHMAAAQALTASGSTGTRAPTFSTGTGPAEGWAGIMFAIAGVRITPVAITDSGAGDDLPTVDKTELRTATDTGAGDDPAAVFADQLAADDGTGVDTVAVDQLVDIVVDTDSGTGVDTIAVADFIGNDLAELASGDDTTTVVRTNFVDLTDSATGVDDHALLRELAALVDSATGLDALTGLGIPAFFDEGLGEEFLSIREIPFTQIQGAAPTTTYDLVVVARVPQESGPPTFIEVDPIEWSTLNYADTLSQPQELTATCQIDTVPESVRQRLRSPFTLPTELWLHRNGRVVFAGPLWGWQLDGETLTITAKGLLAYLRYMVVDSDKRFDQVDQAAIATWMIDQWQALPHGHYGIDTSTVAASGVLRDGTYLRSELHNVGQRVEDLGGRINGFDIEVDPATRRLQLWSPIKGIDRSTGEDAIVFDERNITRPDVLCSVAVGDIATVGYGSGSSIDSDKNLLSVQDSPELRAVYGRIAITSSWHDVSQQGTLDDHTRGLLDARDQVLMLPGPSVQVTSDTDLDAYGVGDTVSYELNSALGVSGSFRLRRRRVAVSGAGTETADLEFV